MISDARTPRPGAANGVAPKKGVGMVFWIDGAPGMADMVKVEAPSTRSPPASDAGESLPRGRGFAPSAL